MLHFQTGLNISIAVENRVTAFFGLWFIQCAPFNVPLGCRRTKVRGANETCFRVSRFWCSHLRCRRMICRYLLIG